MNNCDIIGTPNVRDDENENDPQNLKKSDKPQVMKKIAEMVRPPTRLMELSNFNIIHHVDNYCAMMVKISELKTDSQE